MKSKDWKPTKLGDLISSIDSGVSVNAENRLINDGEVGVLKTSSVVYGIFDPLEHKAILNRERQLATIRPRKDSILICRSNTIELVGICAYISKDYGDLFLPDTLWQITTNRDLCSAKWLNYALNSDDMRRKIQSIATGTSGSMKKISMANFRKLEILLPPLPLQQKMADYLGVIDKAIGLIQRKIDAKKLQKEGVLQRIVSGKYRLPEYQNTSWTKNKLKDIFEIRDEYSGQTDDLQLYSLTIENGVTPKTDRYDRQFLVKQENKKYKVVYPNDIVYNPPNLRYGAIALNKHDKPVLVSPSYEVLCVKDKDSFSEDFVSFVITTKDQIKRFSQRAEGTLVERMSVRPDALLTFEILVPSSKDEQQSLAHLIKTMEREVDLLSSKLKKYELLKSNIIHMFMTGKVNVKNLQ
jgi:type I restriction enzyme S subunit